MKTQDSVVEKRLNLKACTCSVQVSVVATSGDSNDLQLSPEVATTERPTPTGGGTL